MHLDDAQLCQWMVAAQQGDGASYRALLGVVLPWLRAYFTRRIAPSALDDLVQEVVLAIHQKRATYDAARPFVPWMLAIARYRWLDHLRRHYRDVARDGLMDIDDTPSHESAVMAKFGVDQLLAAIPKAHAIAIELVKVRGCSIAEAAAQSGQSEAQVKVNIHRGLQRMAALVEKA